MEDKRCIECQEFFPPNSYKQIKCEKCRFKKPLERQRTSGVPNPIRWAAVPEEFGQFEINTIGTVRSQYGYIQPNARGVVKLNKNRYERKSIQVGRLLKLTFDPISDTHTYDAVPKNGNIRDYRLENWEWKKAHQHNGAKLNKEKAEKIRQEYFKDTNLTQAELASQHEVAPRTISHLINRETWA